METIFDWITVIIFSGLIVLFLQRSSETEPRDQLWQYLLPSAGCAVANYLGNEGYSLLAFLAIAAVLGFVGFVLRPF
ncbi:MAG: XrtV sorting system accessory protein [Sphingomonadaceae bacterium]